jgi:hypothetical protein
MHYPRGFPAQARAQIAAKQIYAKRKLEQHRRLTPPADWTTSRWDETALQIYILSVFREFGRAACELGIAGLWTVDRIRSEAEEFLRRFTIEAYSEHGRDRSGGAFLDVTSRYDGSLLPRVRQKFHSSEEWRQFETGLLRVAKWQSKPVVASVSPANGRRSEVDSFLMKCGQATSCRITRKHIWQAAGHSSARQFQFWQAVDPKATMQDDQNFQRILSMKPDGFLDLLRKKDIL